MKKIFSYINRTVLKIKFVSFKKDYKKNSIRKKNKNKKPTMCLQAGSFIIIINELHVGIA